MTRKAFLVDSNSQNTIWIMVDEHNADMILEYLVSDEGVKREFREICDLLKGTLRNKTKYCKCEVSKKAKNMFEMRFVRNRRNDRIYCKEMNHGSIKVIIMAELFQSKKTQKIDKKQKSRIENIGGHNYEFDI